MDGWPDPFEFRAASAAAIPVQVSIPHTGTFLPDEVARTLSTDAMRRQPMTDWHLHHLYDFLPSLGIDTLFATTSRFVIDLNRGPDARPLYPGRFETGLVPLQTFQGEEVFARPPSAELLEQRRRRVHEPYHRRLAELLDEKVARFGHVLLIDAHSVASRANRLHGALEHDIYLGNRDGATCEDAVLERVAAAFTDAGLTVSRNDPYKGGWITDHYGRRPGVQALQIEMCQRVYMDEDDPDGALGDPRFEAARQKLRGVFARFVPER